MHDPGAIFARHPYFASLPAPTVTAIAARATARTYERGALVYAEGQVSPGLYLVASGTIRIFKASGQGKEQDLYHVGAGESFNDGPAFDGGTTLANAEALDPSLVLVVRTETLLDLMAEHPALGPAVARGLAARLREISTLAGDLSLRHLAARVAGLLLRRPPAGPAGDVVTLPSRQHLAAMVGTVREVATRALRHLEDAGIIRLEPRGRVVIVDRVRLQRVSSGAPRVRGDSPDGSEP